MAIIIDHLGLKHIGCHKCGTYKAQLFRVRGTDGKKSKPALYECEICIKAAKEKKKEQPVL